MRCSILCHYTHTVTDWSAISIENVCVHDMGQLFVSIKRKIKSKKRLGADF